jgi:hypothetical protein
LADVIDFNLPLVQQCENIWDYTRDLERVDDSVRKEGPLTRIWDAEWGLQHILGNEYAAKYSWISNDTGPGQTELPADSPAALWIQDDEGRIARGEGRNVCITVDYCGARWSGIMDKFAVEQRDDGDTVLVVDWLHDYEHLKWHSIFPNPFLPAAFQFPRAFLLAGPVDWVLKLTLFVNLFREHNPLITVPDDPLDLTEWFTSIDMSTWHMVVKPSGFLQSIGSGIIWGILISRMGNWHDAARDMLDDAELSVRCDRYLDGDDPPWPGADLRHGTLVIDIVDKSGVYIGTSHGGTVFAGLIRTGVEFAEDFIDSSLVVLADADVPADYYEGGTRWTRPELRRLPGRRHQPHPNIPIHQLAQQRSTG